MTATIALPPIDWDAATATGARLIPAGPSVTPGEAAQLVAELRECAVRAQPRVRETARIDAPTDTAPVLVVDRASWVRGNVESMRGLLGGLGAPEDDTSGFSARASGAELGSVLAWLGTKVLGQFDPFHEPAGRLLLVAPNVLHAERQLGVDPHDFRLWVCLHEETHRVQFTAHPWLREHLRAEATGLLHNLDLTTPALSDLLRRLREDGNNVTLLDLIGQDAAATRGVIERVTAVMSLLEGHADVVMDEVGPAVVGSVSQIRRRFEQRRTGRGVDRLVRRLLGLDLKLAQYRDGARFCRAVVDRVGFDGFNRVFASAEALPTLAEIHDPGAWLRRQGFPGVG
ncbi:zinc-dependent metalloprotease [Naumannella sp. ID2617S]|nr:zinc-dependent metalloprotease [Naumannella sp. ID2617S]